ncbi:hypothetical protein [Thiolapillus sp.]|uniref:hypothetical protein n=1 Tax=Thiolapillus sp. TaxID=2017437 RepID=UPI003AF4D08D
MAVKIRSVLSEGVGPTQSLSRMPTRAMPGDGLQRAAGMATQALASISRGIYSAKRDSAVASYKEQVFSSLYNSEDGFLMRKGEDALDSQEDYVKHLDEMAQTLEDELPTNVQADFRKSIEPMRLQALQKMGTYTLREAESLKKQAMASEMNTALHRVAMVYRDDAQLDEVTMDVMEAAERMLAMNGITDPKVIAATRAKALGQATENAVVYALANGDTGRAAALLQDRVTSLDPDVALALRKKIESQLKVDEAEQVLAMSQAASDQIYAENKPVTVMYEEARSIPDPKVRQKALALIEHRVARAEQVARDEQRDAYGEGLLTLASGGTYEDLSPTQLANMSMTQQADLLQKSKAQRGAQAKAKAMTLKHAASLFSSMSISEIKSLDFAAYAKDYGLGFDAFQVYKQALDNADKGIVSETHKAIKNIVSEAPAIVGPNIWKVSGSNAFKRNRVDARYKAVLNLALQKRTRSALMAKAEAGEPLVFTEEEKTNLVLEAIARQDEITTLDISPGVYVAIRQRLLQLGEKEDAQLNLKILKYYVDHEDDFEDF